VPKIEQNRVYLSQYAVVGEVGRMENIIVDIIAGEDKLVPWSLGGSVAAALNSSASSKFVDRVVRRANVVDSST
jgi:hypothetical protein